MTETICYLRPPLNMHDRTFSAVRHSQPRKPPLQAPQPIGDITVVIPIMAALHFEVDLPYGGDDRSLATLLFRMAQEAVIHYCAKRHSGGADAAQDYTDGELTWDLTDFLLTYTAPDEGDGRHHYIDNGGKRLHVERV